MFNVPKMINTVDLCRGFFLSLNDYMVCPNVCQVYLSKMTASCLHVGLSCPEPHVSGCVLFWPSDVSEGQKACWDLSPWNTLNITLFGGRSYLKLITAATLPNCSALMESKLRTTEVFSFSFPLLLKQAQHILNIQSLYCAHIHLRNAFMFVVTAFGAAVAQSVGVQIPIWSTNWNAPSLWNLQCMSIGFLCGCESVYVCHCKITPGWRTEFLLWD